METREVTERLPATLAEELDRAAEDIAQPRARVMELAINHWLKEEHEKYLGTLRGLADVDAGRVVDHARVVEWLQSLGTDHPLPMPEP